MSSLAARREPRLALDNEILKHLAFDIAANPICGTG